MTSSKTRAYLLVWWAVCGLAGAGCDRLLGKEQNLSYCASPPCLPPDTGGGCISNADCTAPGAQVCDIPSGQCVQCTTSNTAACTGTAPVCEAIACRACRSHAECPSSACSFDGSCLDGAMVAYVDESGIDNATCDQMHPCGSVAMALSTGRMFVKIHGTIQGEVTVSNRRVVTFLADPGATLTRTGGDILTIKDAGTSAAIYDLTISHAGDAAVGVTVQGGGSLSLTSATISDNVGGGIAVSGGSLQLTRSMIRDNLGGGVNITGGSAKFSIVSNMFLANGSDQSSLGGVSIQNASSTSNLLAFNTFYQNKSNGMGSAIQCSPATFTARANIMFSNGTTDQTSGPCMHVYSLASPGMVPAGATNQSADPMFMNAASGDFHLQSRSPALGAADGLFPLDGLEQQDFDGQRRAKPVNLGAYQQPQ